MEYEELQSRLREKLPGTCIGFMDEKPYVVSTTYELPILKQTTRLIDPSYRGGFAHAPGGSLFLGRGMSWVDDLESTVDLNNHEAA